MKVVRVVSSFEDGASVMSVNMSLTNEGGERRDGSRTKEILVKLRLAILSMLIATSAFGEEASPFPPPPPSDKASTSTVATPQKFYLEVDQADLNWISQALNELPKKIADPLIIKLNGQLQAQEPIKLNADEAEKARKAKRK